MRLARPLSALCPPPDRWQRHPGRCQVLPANHNVLSSPCMRTLAAFGPSVFWPAVWASSGRPHCDEHMKPGCHQRYPRVRVFAKQCACSKHRAGSPEQKVRQCAAVLDAQRQWRQQRRWPWRQGMLPLPCTVQGPVTKLSVTVINSMTTFMLLACGLHAQRTGRRSCLYAGAVQRIRHLSHVQT